MSIEILRGMRGGVAPEDYALSERYGSTPPDGAAAGHLIHPVFAEMRRRYYKGMGWHSETGRPLPKTLRRPRLERLIADLRPDAA